jgi:hypothetical protein
MRSVFSGLESFGVYSGSTDEIRSRGGFLDPTFGISFAMVEFVLVMCGFKGFSIWYLRCSGFVSCSFAFPGFPNDELSVTEASRRPLRAAKSGLPVLM